MLMSAGSSRPPKVVVPLGVMAWAGSLMVSVAAGKVPVATVRVPLAVDEVRDAVAKTQGGRCCGAGHSDGAIPGDAYPAAVGEAGAAGRGPGVGVSHLAAGQQVDHERDACAHGTGHEQCAGGGEADAGGGRARAPGGGRGPGARGGGPCRRGGVPGRAFPGGGARPDAAGGGSGSGWVASCSGPASSEPKVLATPITYAAQKRFTPRTLADLRSRSMALLRYAIPDAN